VIDLYKTADGRVLASTFGKGVYEISANGAARQAYSVPSCTLKDDHVYATLIDKNGNLWIGCLYGELMMKDATDVHYYPVDNVQCIIQLPSGEVAVGTANGIKLLSPGKTEIGELNYQPEGSNDVNRYVISMFVNQGRELWIATDGGGVYIYDLSKKACRQLTTENGLPSNCVSSLVAGGDGRIWVATEQGLAFVDPKDPEKAIDVNYCYGLAREYSSGAAALLNNGEILFGSTTGAVRINPQNVQAIDYTTQLHIMGVSCGDDDDVKFKEQVHEMLAKDELELSYGQNTFDLYYESINLRNQFDIAYQYQMGNGEWSQLTDQQYIRFTNLVPGKHRLLLRAVSRTSGAVLDEKELEITIRQPWWNSWWMWCIYLTLLALAFYGAWRVYQLHNKYMRLTIDHLQLVNNKELPENVSAVVAPQQDVELAVKPDQKPAGQAGDGKDFVDKATRLIVEHLSDSDFTIDKLCSEMAMSRTLFYVKLKSFTGKSPQDFMRVIRLERAAALLRNGNTVTDAASLAGFENPKYFSTVFKKYFGVSPSKYNRP
jgi:AraC-like DNA-binding protein